MNRREVEFPSENPAELIRADLYTADEGKGPWPIVIMGGGWCYVKELIMPEYAEYFGRALRAPPDPVPGKGDGQ